MSFNLMNRNNLVNKYLKFLRFCNKPSCVLHSTQIQQKPPTGDQIENKAIKDFENLTKMYKRAYIKKPQKSPFVKNLFLGEYDTDILTYPEIGGKEDVARFENFINPIEYSTTLTGLRAPQLCGGKEFNVTEVCRFGETVMENFGRFDLVQSENFGVQFLIKFGSENIISKYINLITSKNFTIAMCVAEFANNTTKMKAERIDNNWVINGEMPLVINGNGANLFIVIAENNYMSQKGLREVGYTTFIIEREFGGISSTVSHIKIGETDVSTVKFCNVSVPAENVLGEVNKGKEYFPKLLTEYRLSFGPVCSSLLKNCLDKFVHFCKTSENSSALINADIVFNKITKMASFLYAMESMTFLTAGLLDTYENQDCEMEAAIVKAFSTQQCQKSILGCLSFMANSTYLQDNWCRDLHESSLNILNIQESIDSLKLIISLQGLQHAGVEMQEVIKKLRNPFFFVSDVVKNLWKNRKQEGDNPELTLGLKNYLHPSLQQSADGLEYCVVRLQYLIETLLAREGPEIMKKHVDLIILADCIIDIYAATACLGRASRSYCIGLRHSDQEMVLAIIFTYEAKERVKRKINKLIEGPILTDDGLILTNGEYLLKNGKYYPEHPTTRNFF